MVQLNKKEFQEALQVAQNKQKLPTLYQKLKTFIEQEYKMNVLSFNLSSMPHSERYHLMVILWDEKSWKETLEKDGVQFDKSKQRLIAQWFHELCLEFHLSIIPKINEIEVSFINFTEEYKVELCHRTNQSIGQFLEKRYQEYGIWKMMTMFKKVYVFYLTNKAVQRNEDNGINKVIYNIFVEQLKGLDSLQLCQNESFEMVFDSKENLDYYFQGNFYNYFK